MEMGSQYFRRRPRFRVADGPRRGAVILGAPAVAAGDIQIMRLVPRLFEQQQCPGHVKLDIVRVRPDGYDGLARHTLIFLTPPARPRSPRSTQSASPAGALPRTDRPQK